jgi:hypothetical protein
LLAGLVVRINADALLTILSRGQSPLVVVAETGLLKSKFKYLTNYKELNFYTESSKPIDLPADAEIVTRPPAGFLFCEDITQAWNRPKSP